MQIFLDPDGYPPITPPWGTLNAIDLNKGEIRWTIPFGEYPKLAAQGVTNTGTDNYGGAIVTANGLLLIGATTYDKKFHAFDKATGKLLWETTLPASGNATPSLYMVNGKEYLVIACGGGKNDAESGGTYVAFRVAQRDVRTDAELEVVTGPHANEPGGAWKEQALIEPRDAEDKARHWHHPLRILKQFPLELPAEERRRRVDLLVLEVSRHGIGDRGAQPDHAVAGSGALYVRNVITSVTLRGKMSGE